MNVNGGRTGFAMGTAALAVLLTAVPGTSATGPWTVQPTPDPSTTTNALNAVDAVAGGAWAVGTTVTGSPQATNRTLVLQNTGSGWVRQSSPNDKHPNDSLGGVAATSLTNAWAVGQHAAGAVTAVLVLHYDGNGWHRQAAPHSAIDSHGIAWALTAVAATGAQNAWAVGNEHCTAVQCVGYSSTFIEHWDGSRWRMQLHPQGSDISYLNAVTAVDHSHAWAAGRTTGGSLVLRWNGTKWSKTNAPSPNKSAELNGIDALSRTNVWAAGDYTKNHHARTLILHHTSTGWHRIASPNKGGRATTLTSVAALSAHNIWAVGSFHGTDGKDHTLIEHYDGSAWSIVSSPNLASTNNTLDGIAGSSPANVFAVGSTSGSGQSATLAMHCC